jgi:hypothetical protein
MPNGRSLTRAILLLHVLVFVTACRNTGSMTSPSPSSSSNRRVNALSSAMTNSSGKVTLCHRTGHSFHSIVVASAAVRAHLAHGDGHIGEPVPDSPGHIFGSDCSIVLSSVVVYSNFGPNLSFDTDSSHAWLVGGLFGQFGVAHQFTPPQTVTFTGTYLGLVFTGGNPSVVVSLHEDLNGLPGPILDQTIVTGSIGTPTALLVPSTQSPTLFAGAHYWISVLPNGPGVVAGWTWNSTGDVNTPTNSAVINSFSPWMLAGVVAPRAAFQVTGTPVP